jgi:hypothetical protein
MKAKENFLISVSIIQWLLNCDVNMSKLIIIHLKITSVEIRHTSYQH